MQRVEKLHYIELPLPISKPAKRTKKRKQAGGEPSNQKQAELALEVQKVLDRAAECGPGGILRHQVRRIVRVQNPALWAQFEAKRKKIMAQLGCDEAGLDEREMFHGTNFEALKSITAGGFDIAKSVCGVKGTFFAHQSSYSRQYSMAKHYQAMYSSGMVAVGPGGGVLFTAVAGAAASHPQAESGSSKDAVGKADPGDGRLVCPPSAPGELVMMLCRVTCGAEGRNRPHGSVMIMPENGRAYPEYIIYFN